MWVSVDIQVFAVDIYPRGAWICCFLIDFSAILYPRFYPRFTHAFWAVDIPWVSPFCHCGSGRKADRDNFVGWIGYFKRG